MSHPNHPAEELGYNLYPPKSPNDPGHPRVDIRICETPTGLHFDPFRVSLTVYTGMLGLQNLVIHHPWHGDSHYHLVPGQIHVDSHTGKSLEAFTFGGELEFKVTPDCTLVVLKSGAPILFNYIGHTIGNLLAEEAEILLAERRAARDSDPETYDQHLEHVDPRELYLAILRKLENRFHKNPTPEQDLYYRFMHMVKDQCRLMEKVLGHRDGEGPDLDQLL